MPRGPPEAAPRGRVVTAPPRGAQPGTPEDPGGSTLNADVQTIQDELAHSVTGLRHSGHCSAPMTI